MGARRQGLLNAGLHLLIAVAQHQGPMTTKIIHIFIAVGIPLAGAFGTLHIDAVWRCMPGIMRDGGGEVGAGLFGQGQG